MRFNIQSTPATIYHCLIFHTNGHKYFINLKLVNTTIACKLHYKFLFNYFKMKIQVPLQLFDK